MFVQKIFVYDENTKFRFFSKTFRYALKKQAFSAPDLRRSVKAALLCHG